MSKSDIRWQQRYNHFLKAFALLQAAVILGQQRPLSELEQQGLIQAFEFTHELAWKTLKDFLESRGAQKLYGSKDATREAFKHDLITDGEVWMDMIKSRNLTAHTYDEATTTQIATTIMGLYLPAFEAFSVKFALLKQAEEAAP